MLNIHTSQITYASSEIHSFSSLTAAWMEYDASYQSFFDNVLKNSSIPLSKEYTWLYYV